MRLIPILLTLLNLVESSRSEFVDPNCPWVLTKTDKVNFTTLKSLFRDYDLSLVCISKCDDQLLECISTCSSTECILECNRAWAICSDCEYLFNVFKHKIVEFSACPCHTDCIDGCQGCENPICFCNVSRNYKWAVLIRVRTIPMLITKMPVWVRQVKLLANVFWIAMVTTAARLLVCRPSKMSTANVLARFIMELTKCVLILFHRKNAR